MVSRDGCSRSLNGSGPFVCPDAFHLKNATACDVDPTGTPACSLLPPHFWGVLIGLTLIAIGCPPPRARASSLCVQLVPAGRACRHGMTVPGGIPRCRTGGIKPCVSAFGADQFGAHQADRLPFFFMAFYFAINVGTKKIGTLEPLPPRARASAAPAL
jgi:hypothetical protein